LGGPFSKPFQNSVKYSTRECTWDIKFRKKQVPYDRRQ